MVEITKYVLDICCGGFTLELEQSHDWIPGSAIEWDWNGGDCIYIIPIPTGNKSLSLNEVNDEP